MLNQKKPNWSEAPKWATVLLELKGTSKQVFAESKEDGSRAWPTMVSGESFAFYLDGSLNGSAWSVVEYRPTTPHAHVHAEVIKQWADDTSLCILSSDRRREVIHWLVLAAKSPVWSNNFNYFLTPEKYVQVFLNWFNGGEMEYLNPANDGWKNAGKYRDDFFIIEGVDYRTAPPKFKAEPGQWYLCDLIKEGLVKSGVYYCNSLGRMELPTEEWAGWDQDSVTVTGIATITPIKI